MKPTESFEKLEILTKLKQTLLIANAILSIGLFHYTAWCAYKVVTFLFGG